MIAALHTSLSWQQPQLGNLFVSGKGEKTLYNLFSSIFCKVSKECRGYFTTQGGKWSSGSKVERRGEKAESERHLC